MLRERLKEFRKSKKLSGEAFGNLLGLSKQQVSNIENGVSKLGIDELEIILKEFPDLNIYWLVAGKGEMMIGDERGQDAGLCWKLLQQEEQQHNKLKNDYAALKALLKEGKLGYQEPAQ